MRPCIITITCLLSLSNRSTTVRIYIGQWGVRGLGEKHLCRATSMELCPPPIASQMLTHHVVHASPHPHCNRNVIVHIYMLRSIKPRGHFGSSVLHPGVRSRLTGLVDSSTHIGPRGNMQKHGHRVGERDRSRSRDRRAPLPQPGPRPDTVEEHPDDDSDHVSAATPTGPGPTPRSMGYTAAGQMRCAARHIKEAHEHIMAAEKSVQRAAASHTLAKASQENAFDSMMMLRMLGLTGRRASEFPPPWRFDIATRECDASSSLHSHGLDEREGGGGGEEEEPISVSESVVDTADVPDAERPLRGPIPVNYYVARVGRCD